MLAPQVGDRSENAACDDVALNSGKPVFHLVELGGVSWRVMHSQLGVSREKFGNELGFVSGEIVGYDVDLLAGRLRGDDLPEKADEFGAGVGAAVLPRTVPLSVSSAAYNESVLWRKYSQPCDSARPGERGNTGSSRSRA